MRRAERKLQLSHNVVGDDMDWEGKEMAGVETGNLRSIICLILLTSALRIRMSCRFLK
jgi:hypothetical protein